MPASRDFHDPGCGFRRDDFRHLKACEEPKNWPIGPLPTGNTLYIRSRATSKPAGDVKPTEVALTSHSGILRDSRPLQDVGPFRCECGYVVKEGNRNPSGTLRLHKFNSKAHKAYLAVST